MSPSVKKKKKIKNKKSQSTDYSICSIPGQTQNLRELMVKTVTLTSLSPESSLGGGHVRGRYPEKFQRIHVVSSQNAMDIFSKVFLTMVFPLYILSVE